jgi:hypothetical protein
MGSGWLYVILELFARLGRDRCELNIELDP